MISQLLKYFLMLSIGSLLFLSFNGCKKSLFNPIPVTCKSDGYYYSDSSTSIIFPGAFTPNGDGKNDVYSGTGVNYSNYSMTIRDASGVAIFSTINQASSWNGKNSGGQIVQGYYKAEIGFKNMAGTTITTNLEVTLYFSGETSTCLTKDAKSCKFEDMMDPRYGFIYPTAETFCN